MPLSTRCPRCGADYELDPDAIRMGIWRLCSPCRSREPPPLARPTDNREAITTSRGPPGSQPDAAPRERLTRGEST
jgi:hypothetical protein